MSATESRRAVPRAGRREWVGLAALVLPTLLVSMDLSVLILATPALSADLAPTSAQLLWITDVYGFLIAGSLITMGTLGDRIGRRRLLLVGAASFGVASLAAAFAPTAELLIAARAVQGVAGATLMPSTLALLSTMFTDPRQRTVAVGVWVTSFSAGVVTGPLIAGVLLESFWWGSVFLPNLPVMALLLVLGPRLLPETRDPAPGRFDLTSATMSLAAVLLVIYAVKRVAEDGVGVWPVLVGVAGLAVGVAFVHRQRTLAHPLIDLALFRVPAFSTSVAINLLVGVVMAGTFLLVAQYLQLVLGIGPFQAGLLLVPQAVAIVVSSMLSTVLVRRVPAAYLVSAGLVVAAVGLVILSKVDAGLAVIVAGSVVLGIGVAPASTLSTDLILGSAPPGRAGAASAISETGGELGNALGIAVLGSVGVAVYRGAMPDGAPDTLSGAVDAARDLPAGPAAQLLDTARDAFAAGLQLSAGLGAGAALLAAVAAAVVLRRSAS